MKITLENVVKCIVIVGAISGYVIWQFDVFAQKSAVIDKFTCMEQESIKTFQAMQQSIDCNKNMHSILTLKDQRRKLWMLTKEHPEELEYQKELEEIDKRIDIMIEEMEKNK